MFNIVIQSASFCWCKESYMLNICCFCTNDLAVNLTEKPGSQNIDKDPTWLPTLMFLFIRNTGKIWQLKWKEKIKSRDWESETSCSWAWNSAQMNSFLHSWLPFSHLYLPSLNMGRNRFIRFTPYNSCN